MTAILPRRRPTAEEAGLHGRIGSMTALALLSCASGTAPLRPARREDVPAIVALLAEDELSTGGEGADGDGGLEPYLRAFDAVDADPAHLLVVVEAGGEVVATLQLSVLPSLPHRGALRGQLEGVHVRADHRGGGLGGALVGWAVDEARRRGCTQVQLTSQKRRVDAHRFYERLGFVPSHEGFKLLLG
jgi:GNAT superfamily N-acetyltransferase